LASPGRFYGLKRFIGGAAGCGLALYSMGFAPVVIRFVAIAFCCRRAGPLVSSTCLHPELFTHQVAHDAWRRHYRFFRLVAVFTMAAVMAASTRNSPGQWR